MKTPNAYHWTAFEGLIKIDGPKAHRHWRAADVPDQVLSDLRADELQAVLLQVGDDRYAVYLTHVNSEEIVAIDLLPWSVEL